MDGKFDIKWVLITEHSEELDGDVRYAASFPKDVFDSFDEALAYVENYVTIFGDSAIIDMGLETRPRRADDWAITSRPAFRVYRDGKAHVLTMRALKPYSQAVYYTRRLFLMPVDKATAETWRDLWENPAAVWTRPIASF